MSGAPEHDQRVVVALGVVAIATLAYSLLIAGQILVWFVIVGTLGFFYLAWRAVRAFERIADAKVAEVRDGPR